MRYFFEIAYNGTRYNGWQTQHNATGVQTVVENVLSQVLREPVAVVASGRTDTGVHCMQQFFHADIEKTFEEKKLLQQLNSFLPKDIVIRRARKVKDDAHARYDAVERMYYYRITRTKNPFTAGLAWHYFKPVDVPRMNKAAAMMVGHHDFECFSKVKTDVNHFLCDVKRASWREKGDELEFTIVANRFLRGMVRAAIGTLLDVGTAKISLGDFKNILESRDRKKAGANVPAHGLYLSKVKYPASVFKH
ncbi:MAG TPA: tRNA pseudouridine(38-40) synthase TruA [Ohtaekwangia sp.]|nr:tRNA pseudouridine(38-40) synthase TruA [Ohtaekwangia sp.]